jgi:hypothetical protein
VVGSTPFDINKEGERFVSVVLGYLWMSEEELGYDSTIAGEGRRYTSIQRDGRIERLCLEDLIKWQRSVAMTIEAVEGAVMALAFLSDTAGCSIFRIKYHKFWMAVQLGSEEGLILVLSS